MPVIVDARGPAKKLAAAARKRLAKRLARAVEAAGFGDAEVALSLVGDAEIHRLNREWREVDKPTDVLSFAMREGEGGGLHPSLLGDVIISVETAARQARDEGRTLDEELLRLAVHGFAHLCGYDHATVGEERRMFGWEERLRTCALAAGPVPRIPPP